MNYHFEQEGIVPSPALIYYKDQIERNTEEAIRIAGGAGRMWPHVKTHKMSEMILFFILRYPPFAATEAQAAAALSNPPD